MIRELDLGLGPKEFSPSAEIGDVVRLVERQNVNSCEAPMLPLHTVILEATRFLLCLRHGVASFFFFFYNCD